MMQEDFHATNNARHLKPSEVAKSFIWSESFEKLIQNKHTVILGARGCGKTTLMKMLTLPALYNWPDERAEEIRSNIEFYSVYISTDIYWDVKNQTYAYQLEKYENLSEIISTFSVNSNVFTSLCDTFENVITLELQDKDPEKEIELCKILIAAWKLPKIIPMLKYVKECLNQRVDEVNQLIQNVIFNCKNNDDIPYKDYFNLSFESSIEYIIPVFERIYCIESKKKWALCFDELEFAPLWLQTKLFTSLRSKKQYILYKLSSSPILSLELENKLRGEYRATTGNDVEMIKMWGSRDSEKFSRKIIDSLLEKKFGVNDSEQFFGSNPIYSKDKHSYENGSEFHEEMQDLYIKDKAFEQFLKKRNVDIDNPFSGDRELLDILFRKIKPIVYFRNFYLREDSAGMQKKVSLRKRKTGVSLFFGIEVLSKICDGNPRWLISVVSAILAKSTVNGADKTTQFNELQSAAIRFKNVIGNIPIGLSNKYSITEVIEKIGKYFTSQIVGEEFWMDPKGTVEVDEKEADIPKNIIELLEKGISQGAFILLDSRDDAFDFEVRNKRLKLSFLFFLLYKLPLRNYNEKKLSEILKGTEILTPTLPTLF